MDQRTHRGRGWLAGLLMGAMACGVLGAAGPVAAGGKTTIRWFVGLGAAADGAKARRQAFNAVVRAFNRENPDLKLVVQLGADPVHEEVGTRIASGRPPDIIGPVTLTDLAYADRFLDLQPLIDAAGYDLTVFDPGLLDLYRDEDGTLVGLPFGAFPTLTYYNRDLFDEAGLASPPTEMGGSYTMPDGTQRAWDFETVAEIGRLLTLDANGNDATSPDFEPANVVQWGYHDQYGDLRRTLSTIGGPSSLVTADASGDPVVTLDPAWRDGIGWWYERIWTDHAMPTQSQVSGPLLGDNPFASGRVGMVTAPLWYTCCIRDATGAPVGGWDLAVVPAGLTGAVTAPIHADLLAITAASKDPEAAFRVLQYLLDDPGAGALWAVAPAETAERAAWYEGAGQAYPEVTDWTVADAMLGYPDIPSHQSDLPQATRMQERLVLFRQQLMSDGGADLDLDAEIDQLARDLQTIVDAD